VALDLVNQTDQFEPLQVDPHSLLAEALAYSVDFRDVKGQLSAKRALEVATAGGHNILLITCGSVFMPYTEMRFAGVVLRQHQIADTFLLCGHSSRQRSLDGPQAWL
jgi:hypothetical protein